MLARFSTVRAVARQNCAPTITLSQMSGPFFDGQGICRNTNSTAFQTIFQGREQKAKHDKFLDPLIPRDIRSSVPVMRAVGFPLTSQLAW
jgi:hypothetical protein